MSNWSGLTWMGKGSFASPVTNQFYHPSLFSSPLACGVGSRPVRHILVFLIKAGSPRCNWLSVSSPFPNQTGCDCGGEVWSVFNAASVTVLRLPHLWCYCADQKVRSLPLWGWFHLQTLDCDCSLQITELFCKCFIHTWHRFIWHHERQKLHC